MSGKQRYLEEFEKYKHIKIVPGKYKHKQGMDMEVLSVDEVEDKAIVRTTRSGFECPKTLHWCRKNLVQSQSTSNGESNEPRS